MQKQNQPPQQQPPQQPPQQQQAREVEILDIRTVPSTEPERAGQMDTLVTYQLDPQHVYMIRIQKEKPSTEEIHRAVREDFAGKQEVIGTRIQV